MDIKHLGGSLTKCWGSGGTAVKTRKKQWKTRKRKRSFCAGVSDIDALSRKLVKVDVRVIGC